MQSNYETVNKLICKSLFVQSYILTNQSHHINMHVLAIAMMSKLTISYINVCVYLIFHSRINSRITSRAPGWIHIAFDDFSTKKQLQNCLKSSRLDSYEIWSFSIHNQLRNGRKSSRLHSYESRLCSNYGSIESTQELQTGFIWNLIMFQSRIN